MDNFSDMFLGILTKTNKSNEMFFDKLILGLTSAQWVEHHLTSFFKGVFCSAQKEDFPMAEQCVFVDWDTPTATIEQLRLDSCLVHLSARTFSCIEKTLQTEILNTLTDKGVVLHDRSGLCVDQTVVVERGAEICSPNFLKGKCVVKGGAIIQPYCNLENVEVGRDSQIKSSTLADCQIGEKCVVGPYAYIRPNSIIGNNCRIGNYVEIKNSVIGAGTKIAHLTYVGDAEVGRNVNIGCGVVFANYDGRKKHKTSVGDDCFIGSNVNLIAPIKIGKGAFIAAGTTVTDEVNENEFAIGRVRQTNKVRRKEI